MCGCWCLSACVSVHMYGGLRIASDVVSKRSSTVYFFKYKVVHSPGNHFVPLLSHPWDYKQVLSIPVGSTSLYLHSKRFMNWHDSRVFHELGVPWLEARATRKSFSLALISFLLNENHFPGNHTWGHDWNWEAPGLPMNANWADQFTISASNPVRPYKL